MKPCIPYKLPIKELRLEALIPILGKANRSLARYDGVLYGLPNPAVLLSPLTTQEAVLSSKIEGTIATLSEVLKFEAGDVPDEESKKDDIQEIINYRMAMNHAVKALKDKPFNLNGLLELHSILLDSVRGRDKGRGTFRATQNWIGLPGTPIEQADFVPPEPMFLMKHMDNWEKFYHAERPDPLIQLAIVHAQFEIIHPFHDGNGRIGRLLIPLFLYEKELLTSPMFYLSAYFEEHRDEYVARLRVIGQDEDGWHKWIEFFLKAIYEQAQENASKSRVVMNLYKKLKKNVVELTHSQYSGLLLDRIFEQPIFQSTSITFPSEIMPSRQAVAGLLRKLREAGILKVVIEGSGRRAQVLVLAELVNLCEGKEVF